MIIESCHDLVPPETIKPVTERIIQNFVTEYCPNMNIVVGLNAMREILMRQPLALDAAQIEYLVEFRSYKNSSVVSAAKSLVNFFRDICPQLLPKKFLGRDQKLDGKTEDLIYGQ
jgi:protein SDA1